jgi:hypothetical protein
MFIDCPVSIHLRVTNCTTHDTLLTAVHRAYSSSSIDHKGKMALAPPQQLYPPRSPSSTSPSPGRTISPRPPLSLDTSTTTTTHPIPIPPFLQNILSSHAAPPTPTPTSATANANPYASSAALYTLPQAPPPPEDPLIPPENFSIVSSGVYRSGFPKKRNFKFMETLRLKTVLTLVLEDYPDTNLKWCEERDVQFMVGSPLRYSSWKAGADR